ncbi:contractile injection system protein, VgrG/Pvc8 family [Fodinicurvata sp. EGI_FJ10296]|uniref:phage late control D family protein n=1 Tax=Fodinicurvata sp. EGI_FJ10296 TaxID=3231908 RepID=UPI0034511C27
MSETPENWTPAFRLVADNTDITESIADRLVSLSVEDQAEDKSDRLTLEIDDRPDGEGRPVALPAIGTRLDLWLGYRETGLAEIGHYRVDELGYAGPPARLDIKARAAAMAGPIRSRQSRSWHRVTLGDIARRVAGDHGLDPRVDAALADLPVPHADQQGESDLAFLNRIARGHDAVARPHGDWLILAPRGRARAATGEALDVLTLTPGDVSTWSYTHAARRESGEAGQGGGMRAWWWDHEAGERRSVERGSPPFEEVTWIHHSEAEARAAVGTETNTRERNKAELSLTLPGRADVVAEGRLRLADWRPEIPTDWRITRVTHRLAARGYSLRLRAETFAPDQSDPAALAARATPHPDDAL